ncbi:MAG: 4-diphosphocytidyl-2C-methyl-D-erythritol 2-phosphate synthase [Verrucomicrobiota bacterium]
MSGKLSRSSLGKVNLLLNVLGRREDGFHELETLMVPVGIADELTLERGGGGIDLTCSRSDLPTDGGNLVYRAAEAFCGRAGVREGVRIHLEKRMPLEAGMGGGSSNAATTLLLMNEAFGGVLGAGDLQELAGGLGSDVPFFLGSGPGVARGRGERVEPVGSFGCLEGVGVFLVHPGFGVSTPWAYKQLAHFPELLNGRVGRVDEMVEVLRSGDARVVGELLYNALEEPVLNKYPLLMLFQEFLKGRDSLGVLMSGSGSTTFSLWGSVGEAREVEAAFRAEFGEGNWTWVGELGGGAHSGKR